MTLRSATAGTIDYSKANRFDPGWWRQWRLKIQTMRENDNREILTHAFQFNLALVSNGKITPEDFSKVQRTAKELFEDVKGNIRPWTGKTSEDRNLNELEQFKRDWERFAGFALDDEEAMDAWEDNLEFVAGQKSKVMAEAATASEATHRAMVAKMEEIAEKRRRQQRGIR